MTKSITIIAAGLLSAFVAGATDIPKYEAFLGFTYVRANQFNQNTGLGQAIGGFDMTGGSAQFIYNFNKYFSGVADVGAVTKQNVGVINADDTTTFYLFGPRVSYRNKSRFTPYVEVLFGGATRDLSRQLNVVTGEHPGFSRGHAAGPVSGGRHEYNGSSERYPNGLCHGGGRRP